MASVVVPGHVFLCGAVDEVPLDLPGTRTGERTVGFEWESGRTEAVVTECLVVKNLLWAPRKGSSLSHGLQELRVSMAELPALLACDFSVVGKFVKSVFAGQMDAVEQWQRLVSAGSKSGQSVPAAWEADARVISTAVKAQPEARVWLFPFQFAWSMEGSLTCDAFEVASALRNPLVGSVLLAHVHAHVWANFRGPFSIPAPLFASKVLSLEDVSVVHPLSPREKIDLIDLLELFAPRASLLHDAGGGFAGPVHVTAFRFNTTDLKASLRAVRSISWAIQSFRVRVWPKGASSDPVHLLVNMADGRRCCLCDWEAVRSSLEKHLQELASVRSRGSSGPSSLLEPHIVLVSQDPAAHRMASQIVSDSLPALCTRMDKLDGSYVIASFVLDTTRFELGFEFSCGCVLRYCQLCTSPVAHCELVICGRAHLLCCAQGFISGPDWRICCC